MFNSHLDIIIVGAGSAGVAAAVAASKEGKKVLVIEKSSYGGGKATAAEVGTICGLFHQGNEATAKWLVKGYARYFAGQLIRKCAETIISTDDGLHFIRYKIDDFSSLVHEELTQNQVEVWYESEVIMVNIVGENIQTVTIRKNERQYTFHCKSIVDCSGDAVIAHLAGVEMIKSDKYQAASRVFTLAGVHASNEQALSLSMWRSIMRGVKEGHLNESFSKVFLVPGSFIGGSASFKLTIPIEVTHQDVNHKLLHQYSIEMIHELVHFLNGQLDFMAIQLVSIAKEVGIRTGPRPKGHEILTEEDVLNARKWENAIARSAWPVEFWSTDKKVEMRYLQSGEYYEIPAGCLRSKEVHNLFFAGRMISADERAIASARVMGVCLQTGYAAGILAAFHVDKSDVDSAIRYVQSKQILS